MLSIVLDSLYHDSQQLTMTEVAEQAMCAAKQLWVFKQQVRRVCGALLSAHACMRVSACACMRVCVYVRAWSLRGRPPGALLASTTPVRREVAQAVALLVRVGAGGNGHLVALCEHATPRMP